MIEGRTWTQECNNIPGREVGRANRKKKKSPANKW
jgi:hypothetical protein